MDGGWGKPLLRLGGTFCRLTLFNATTPKSYQIATIQRHITSKRSGKQERCKLVCEQHTRKTLCQRERNGGGGGAALRLGQVCQLVLLGVRNCSSFGKKKLYIDCPQAAGKWVLVHDTLVPLLTFAASAPSVGGEVVGCTTMGRVCFTAIRSNRLHSLHCCQFSVLESTSKLQWLGLGARSLPRFSTLLGQLSPVEPVGTQTLS